MPVGIDIFNLSSVISILSEVSTVQIDRYFISLYCTEGYQKSVSLSCWSPVYIVNIYIDNHKANTLVIYHNGFV